MSGSKFADMFATALRDGCRRKDFSPVEVTDTMLASIKAWNPVIKAFLHVDGEAALDQARAPKSRWRTGAPQGLLDGVPTAVKDGLSMTGVPIYRGSLANGSNDELATVAAGIASVIRHRYCRVGTRPGVVLRLVRAQGQL